MTKDDSNGTKSVGKNSLKGNSRFLLYKNSCNLLRDGKNLEACNKLLRDKSLGTKYYNFDINAWLNNAEDNYKTNAVSFLPISTCRGTTLESDFNNLKFWITKSCWIYTTEKFKVVYLSKGATNKHYFPFHNHLDATTKEFRLTEAIAKASLLIRILAGDIETNPGPKGKFIIGTYNVRGCKSYNKLKRLTTYLFKLKASSRFIFSLQETHVSENCSLTSLLWREGIIVSPSLNNATRVKKIPPK